MSEPRTVYLGLKCPRCGSEDCIPSIVPQLPDVCAECAWPDDYPKKPQDVFGTRRKWQPELVVNLDDEIKEDNDV